MSTGESGITVQQFYDDTIVSKMEGGSTSGELELDSAFLGKSKESLDRIDLSLSLDSAIALFGPFLRFHTHNKHQELPPLRNAFDVLMYSQRQQLLPTLPSCVPVRTKKDKLFNDFVGYLKDDEVFFPGTEVNSYGINFVKTMVDCLWYLDGHYDKLKKQSCPVPELCLTFTGYNTPELSKHRKRQSSNMSASTLNSLTSSLFRILQASFWSKTCFKWLHDQTQVLAKSLAGYSDYLSSQKKLMKTIHARTVPVRELSDALAIKYVQPCNQIPLPKFDLLVSCVEEANHFKFLSLNEFTPAQPTLKYEYIHSLERNGIRSPIMLLIHSSGNNVGNLHFVWKVPLENSLEANFEESLGVIEQIKPRLPQFHTRAMRQAMFEKFGRVSPNVKPSVLRFFYRNLTGDCSASHDMCESIIDERVQEIINIEPEDPNTVINLREVKSNDSKTKFDVFWDEAKKYINEDLGAAVDDRRHGEVTHLVKAISIHDLCEQVVLRCPPDAVIPSNEWLRLQFWPKTPKANVSLHYTGRLNVRFMIQKWQFRASHEGEHYAAAVFHYHREYAIKLKEYCLMVCIDDKRRLKVGEPGFPVAAAERGKKVLVRAGTTMEVGDHDFTKFSVVPSVALVVDIPDKIDESWYRGQVFVGFKDTAFEQSSPLRHATELSTILSNPGGDRSVLFLYSDGGPDHRLTYASVQVSLIALFLKLDLDFLCAARTAPSHSWRNPVERIMSTLNLGLQCVGLMRGKR